MKCPRCQHENPPQAKFCLECGARVALTCTKCRGELPAGAKFCLECGAAVASQATAEPRFASPESYTPKHLAEKILTSKSALEGERKQVTVLFADLKGSRRNRRDRCRGWVTSRQAPLPSRFGSADSRPSAKVYASWATWIRSSRAPSPPISPWSSRRSSSWSSISKLQRPSASRFRSPSCCEQTRSSSSRARPTRPDRLAVSAA